MPYIQTRTNISISKEKEIKIKELLGEAITILNKSEEWLMVEFVPECKMYFMGDDSKNIAYVDIKIYGKGDPERFNLMTGKVTEILNNELGLLPENIYVSYGEYSNWGWNGNNL